MTVTNMFKEYDGGKVKAVNGLSLHVQPGEILALLGHNGTCVGEGEGGGERRRGEEETKRDL